MPEERRARADRRRRPPSFLDRATEVVRRLRSLCLDLLRARGDGEAAPVEALAVDLSIAVRGGNGDGAAAAALLRRLVAGVDEIVRAQAAFRPGRVYCHFCESADCEHSSPPDTRSVFTGFLATGRPWWQDFASHLLDLKDPRIDSLYEVPAAVLAVVRTGESLKEGQLPVFGRASTAYNVLGQVAAGFLPSCAENGRSEGIAATFQVVESLDARGQATLGLNVVGRHPDGADLEQRYAHEPMDALWRTVLGARGRLREMARIQNARRARGLPREDLGPQVSALLNHLAREVERLQRQRGHRTRHFEERRLSGERPTRKAREDAREAGPGRILVDPGEGTFVVLGHRGRIHVYSPDGREVTSLRFSRPEVEKRLRRGRWRPATEEEAERLRAALGAEGGKG